jgi:FkbM family methyltransferase
VLAAVKRLIPVRWKNGIKQRLRPVRNLITSDYSENGESSYIKRLIKPDFPPFVVDVGAFDGKHLSNTYYFIKHHKWSGIMVEPLPDNFHALQRTYANKPGVICVNKACSGAAGTAKLFLASHGGMATLSTDDIEWFRQVKTNQVLEVPTDTLTNILAEHNCPADFSILSVDTEGLDLAVLTSLDFNRFSPRIIVTEGYINDDEKYTFLREQGYQSLKNLGNNSVWMRKTCSPHNAILTNRPD